MLSCNLWIIGGQQTMKALKDNKMDPILNIMGGINVYCSNHEIVMMWYANKMFIWCTCPKFLNLKFHDKDSKPLIMTKTRILQFCHESSNSALNIILSKSPYITLTMKCKWTLRSSTVGGRQTREGMIHLPNPFVLDFFFAIFSNVAHPVPCMGAS